MILSLSRQIQLRAMIAELGHERAADECDVPPGVLDLVLSGQDVPTWEAHNIVDALDTWEAHDAG